MPMPILDPNECVTSLVSDVTMFLSTGQVPDLKSAIGHGATVAGALLHSHGFGASTEGSNAQLLELAAALGCQSPEGVGGPVTDLLIPILLTKLLPILAEWMIRWSNQQ